MSGNTFGTVLRLTTFGESHGPAIGGVLDGCPSGLYLDETLIQTELDRRKPGLAGVDGTTRKESDTIHLLSGIFEGRTIGTPIGFIIENTDQRSNDYDNFKDLFRIGHADFTFQAKFGLRDHRGGGRSSGRETACRVVGGAIAQEILRSEGVNVLAYTVELGGVKAQVLDLDGAQQRSFFSPDPEAPALFEQRIRQVKTHGDSLGGVVEVQILGLPQGVGEPVFDKLDARLAAAFMSVGAVKGVDIGSGYRAARMLGSQNNDSMSPEGFISNNAGGILGGISTGQPVVARVFVKPIPSIALEQTTVTNTGQAATIRVGGRHDICAIPRIVPVLKAMAALACADLLLLDRRLNRIR